MSARQAKCTVCNVKGHWTRYNYWSRPKAVCPSCWLANFASLVNCGLLVERVSS